MILFGLFSLFLTVVLFQVTFAARRHRLAAKGWDEIVARLRPVNNEGIKLIAEAYLRPGKDQLQLEPDEMLQHAGGFEGLRLLRSNAAVMLDLAVLAERWNQEEGPIVAEMLRRDAVRIRKAVLRLSIGLLWSGDFVRAPFHLQEAASSYFLMRGRLLGFLQKSHIALVPGLTAAL